MTSYLLGTGALLLGGASGWAWWRGRHTRAMLLLMAAAFLLRVVMAALDPFLHDWDERFHALVARNLMAHPGQPMLRADPFLPYDFRAWCCNHIWLHKQPLFLWQMALSMKLFGVNTLAMRLPSVLLSTLLLWPIYRLGQLVFGDALVGYLGAWLVAGTYYQLEMISGAVGMDHNDVAFLVYVTASIWAWYEYRATSQPTWLVLVGALAGAAVLCKWLTGLLVYAGWVLDVVVRWRRMAHPWRYLGQLFASLAVAVVVFLPWQLYTAYRWPLESAYERAYNSRHLTEALEGHAHEWYYHFGLMPMHYGWLLLLVLPGIGLALRRPTRLMASPLLGMALAIYALFTVAATKMYSYTYVVSPLLLLLAALPLAEAVKWLRKTASQKTRLAWAAFGLAIVLLADLRPWNIWAYHFDEQAYEMMPGPLNRPVRESNARLYQQLAEQTPVGSIVFNVTAGDDLEAMFFSGRAVYGGLPSADEVQQLQARGIPVAFYGIQPGQALPGYLSAPGIIPLWGAPAPY